MQLSLVLPKIVVVDAVTVSFRTIDAYILIVLPDPIKENPYQPTACCLKAVAAQGVLAVCVWQKCDITILQYPRSSASAACRISVHMG